MRARQGPVAERFKCYVNEHKHGKCNGKTIQGFQAGNDMNNFRF